MIHTAIVTNHQNQYANQIHALPTDSVSFKTMVNQFVSVHSGWAAIQRQLDVMIMNVIRTAIAPKIMHAWDSDVAIHVPAHAELALAAKLKNIIQFAIVTTAWEVIRLCDVMYSMSQENHHVGHHRAAKGLNAVF